MSLPQLRRVRWAVRATLLLGVAASVAANILHARPNPISEVIAAWPPLALLLTVELISRVPVHRRSLAAVRLLATTAIACIAAWVSYWHMAGVAARYGETGASAYLLPLSVDGLVIVASVSLVELAGRIRLADEAAAAPARTSAEIAPVLAAGTVSPLPGTGAAPALASPVAPALGAGSTTPARATHGADPARANPASAALGADGATRVAIAPASAGAATSAGGAGGAASAGGAAVAPAASAKTAGWDGLTGSAEARPKRTQPRRTSPSRDERPAAKRAAPAKRAAAKDTGPRTRRPVAETAALAAQLGAAEPELTHDELAARLGITTQRLRRIQREVPVAA